MLVNAMQGSIPVDTSIFSEWSSVGNHNQNVGVSNLMGKSKREAEQTDDKKSDDAPKEVIRKPIGKTFARRGIERQK